MLIELAQQVPVGLVQVGFERLKLLVPMTMRQALIFPHISGVALQNEISNRL